MKKLTACLLLMGMLFLCSCTKELAAPVETQMPTTQPKVQTNVAQPLTWEEIDSIPVANDSMTEEQLRQICLDFMRMQLTVCYTPNDARAFQNGSEEKWFNYGTVYAGLPYVSNCKGNLYQLMEFYDSDNGMLDVSREDIFKIIGNQCSSSTFWAWSRVANSALHRDTLTATRHNGCIPVGTYTYDETMVNFADMHTDQICNKNGERVMFESYAQVKPADGLVAFTGSGHVLMVSGTPNVVYGADGKIDGFQSTVTYMDQAADWSVGTQPDGSVCELQGGVDVEISFQTLFRVGYIPFTFGELNKADPVEKAEVTYSHQGETVSLAQLANSVVKSNYSISHVTLWVENDAEVFKTIVYHSSGGYAIMELPVDISKDRKELMELADGTHSITVQATVSTGQRFTLFQGMLVE